ncbi:hypothetical protein, partial [Pseudomonas syringae]|uniref:hypothetical protein n=1 Tax=Pseudomonas syringae TaxID=317 RepID=UPI0019553DC1
SGMKPSRTSLLPQGVAFSLPMQFWGRINCRLLSEGRGGLFREGAGTSAKNVSSGMQPSRTSSLPQGVAFSLPMQFWGRINCRLLSEGRGSGLVREGAGTSAKNVSSGMRPVHPLKMYRQE